MLKISAFKGILIKSLSEARLPTRSLYEKYSSSLSSEQSTDSLFNCPKRQLAKIIHHYNQKENTPVGFLYKDKIWPLYEQLGSDYEFSETEFRAILKITPFSSVSDDIKVERIQELISRMIKRGFNPRGDGLIALIHAYSRYPDAIDKIEALLYNWTHSPPQTKRVYNQLLCIYARVHGAEVAEKWFDSLIGTMIYTEKGSKKEVLRPLIKDGGIYVQLIKMYCEEGILIITKQKDNPVMAIKKFKELFSRFDQSNHSGALSRIFNMLLKNEKHYELLAWYSASKALYMYLDETCYFKVIRAILHDAFSRNSFIPWEELLKMILEVYPEYNKSTNLIDKIKIEDQDEIQSLISALDLNKIEIKNTDSWYASNDESLASDEPLTGVDISLGDNLDDKEPSDNNHSSVNMSSISGKNTFD